MRTQIRRRRILIAALAGAIFAALGVTVASSHATRSDGRELPTSTATKAAFARLTVARTYRASLVSPTPSITPSVPDWRGTQFVTHQSGKVRYESAVLIRSGGEIDILAGPAMTMSPAATIAQPRTRIGHWNFAPYQPPGLVKHWAAAGRQALYFDATAPPPGEWTLVGSNPPELRIDRDNSFRMAALAVGGKTVVIVIHGPAADFTRFLPVAERLVASLRFQPS